MCARVYSNSVSTVATQRIAIAGNLSVLGVHEDWIGWGVMGWVTLAIVKPNRSSETEMSETSRPGRLCGGGGGMGYRKGGPLRAFSCGISPYGPT